MRKTLYPKSMTLLQDVQEVVQGNMKPILGGQFSRIEGEQVLGRAIDLSLPTEVNLKKVRRLRRALESARVIRVKAAEHWRKHGTISNYDAQLSKTTKDILRDMGVEDETTGRRTAPSSREELMRAAEARWASLSEG